MSHARQLALFVEDLKQMRPSGVARVAKMLGSPRQTVYHWCKSKSETDARRILLDVERAAAHGAEDILSPARAALAPVAPNSGSAP